MKFIRMWMLVLFFIILNPSVHAMSLTFSAVPSSIDHNQEVEVPFVFACDGCSDSYFRGVFYKSGSNYFGFTKNNSGDWIGTASDKTQYYKLTKDDLVASSGSGKIVVKPDTADPLFDGFGSYMFKVVRYTSGGNPTYADPVAITITGPSPTPTNSPSPTSTPTNSPHPTVTSTPSPTTKPTNTLTPKVTPTVKPTEKKTPTPKPTESVSEISTVSGQKNEGGDILGAKDDNAASSSVTMERTPSNKVFIITFLFIGIGCALLSLALVLRKQFFQEEGVKPEI